MVKASASQASYPTRTRRPGRRGSRSETAPPRFTQSELWEGLEQPVDVPEAIRKLAALRERLERALELDRARP